MEKSKECPEFLVGELHGRTSLLEKQLEQSDLTLQKIEQRLKHVESKVMINSLIFSIIGVIIAISLPNIWNKIFTF